MPATLSPHGSTASSSAAQPDLPRLNVHYVPSRLPAGVVVGLWGDAVMRQDDGGAHALQLGDVVLKGDVLLTRQNGVVEISLGGDAVATNVRPVTYPTGDDALDRIIASLDNGELEMEPGAGLEGGGDGSLQPGMIVDRVIEIVTPQEYQYAYDRTPSFVEPESADGTLGTGLDQGGGTDTGSGDGGEGSHHAQVGLGGPPSVIEGQTATGYTVSLSQPAATDVTVKLTYSGTATDGSDYTAVTTVTIPAGQSSVTFDLKTLDDALAEGAESVTITIGEISGTTAGQTITIDPAHVSVTTTITDDVGDSGGGTPGAEDTCLVSISGPTSVVEGEPATGYTVSLSQPAATDVTVKLTYSGTATDGSDYTAITTVTVPAGQSSVTFDLKTLDDALAEGSETITISVGDITGGGFEAIAADPAQGSVTTTITDDVGGGGGGTPGGEDTCLVSISGPAAGSITEGESGSYTVSLSQPAATDVTVKLTYSGTATDGSDYTAVTTVTIPAGQSSVTFDLKTIDDALAEGSETITISVGDITGGGFEAVAADPAQGSVTTTITDDISGGGGGTPGAEDTCLVSISGPASVVEGEPATGYTVSLSQPATTDVTVKLTYSGTATDGSDYTAVTTVTIPAGQSSVTFDLKTIDDALAEGSETITISVGDITGGGFETIAADPAQGSITTTITDDIGGSGGGTPGSEDTCLVSIAGPAAGSITEGESGSYTVSLSQPAATDVTVKLTYSGTATDGSDYTAVTTVTIPAGQSSVTFDLKTLDDALAEGSETITVSVGDITGGGFEAIAADPAQGSVTTTITDDVGGSGGGTPGSEDTCLVSISGPTSVVEGEPATGYTVSLSQPAATDVTVKLTYSGTATDGSDYTAVTTVTVPAGQSSVTFDLKTIDDALAEGSETITISVGDITGGGFEAIAADPAQGSVTTTITDDVGGGGGSTPGSEDTCLVSISGPAAGSITEGESGSYTVSLSQPATTDVTVKLTYSGTATDGSDYTAVTTVTVPAGQSSVTFDLKTIDDALAEGSETITISVGDITGGGFEAIAADPAQGSVTTTITDDIGGGGGGTPGAEDTCLVSISGPASVVEGEPATGYTVSLSQPAATDVTVKLTYSGTATDGSDYTAVTTVTVPAGQSSVTFDLKTIDDALAEGSETITISVGDITGGGFEAIAADPAQGSVTTTITDDVGGSGGGTPGSEDTCLVSIAGPAAGSITEGESGSYTVSLSQPATTDVTVKLTYSGTATDGSDYTAVTTVTVPAGQSSVTFDLKTLDDALAEGAESVTITIGEISGGGFEAVAADPAHGSITTTITDDVGGSGGGTPGSEDTCLVSISGPASVVEGEPATGYTVSLSQPAATDVTVKLTYSGTATDGSDYTAVTTVTVPAGQSSVTFDLKTLDDALAEGSETITVSVGDITGGGFEAIAADPAQGSVTTTITDDVGGSGGGTPGAEDTCLVSISGPTSVVEGEPATGYTVSLSQPAATDVTVKLTYSGTATDGSDYTAVTTVTIPAGQSSVTFDLKTIDDALAEGSETITVSVGDITGGGFEAIAADPAHGSITTTITDDVGGSGGGTPGSEDTCLVSISGPPSVVEGEPATGYTVSLSQPAATDVTVKLTYSGTATDGSDYTAVTTVTIPAGQSSVTFDLKTIDDALAEGSETITISVGDITGGGFEAVAADPAQGSVTTTITDDISGGGGGTPGAEDTCLVSISGPASVVEGEPATGYTVSLSQPATTDVTVKLTYSGTATDGSDYTAVTTVTIPAGQSSVTFDLKTIDDALAEGSETITISVGDITGGGFETIAADPAQGSITTTITDDIGGSGGGTPGSEDTCLVSIAGPAAGSITEGESGSYTVSLSQPAATDVTVKLTYSGTATDGSDYTAITTVTVPAGQSSVTFDLKTLDDTLAEGSETITISVGDITGGGFEAIAADPAQGSVTTTITDDVGGSGGGTPGAEDTCLVSISGPTSVVEGEPATGYTVSLSQPAATDVTVKLTYSGTATDGSDYTAITTVTVPAGQSSVTFDLKTLDDALAEGAETITISVGDITGGGFEAIAADPAQGSVTTTITDDVGGSGGGTPGGEDTCLVSISGPAAGSITEGESGSYTVSLSQPAATDVTVKLTYSGTATDGSDYTAVTTVTVPAGQSSVTFDLKTLDDALAEGSETITISVGDITGGGFEAIAADPAQGSVTTTITDDVGGSGGDTPGSEDTCLVSIAGPAAGSITEGESGSYTVSLSQPAATDVTVKLTYSGTAADGSDYTAVTTVTIPAGQSSATFDLKTLDDALAEGAETITISVGDITGGGFEAIAADPAQGSITTTITDDVGGSGGGSPGSEDTCLVSIAGPAAGSITEGESGSYTVSLSQPAATDVTVKLTYSGTATDGSDYTAVTTVTIPAGQSSVTFDLKTIDDALAEGSETITISVGDITGGGFEAIAADPAQGSVTTTITDDVGGGGGSTPGSEDTCLVSISGPAAGSITEGESGSYTVSLSQPATTDVTVKLTYSGTATDGSDYTAVTTVTVPAGQSSVTFDLKTIDDALAEGSETITISVGDITGGGFEAIAADPAQGSVTTTITDDIGGGGGGTPGAEDTCLVSISGPASVVEGEPATGYTVSLSQPAATDVTVKLTYSGTATDGSDYTAVTTVTVPAGQSSVTFDLKTIDDALAEGSETITISVGDITGGGFEAIAADPAQGSVTTTITDDVGGGGGSTPGSEDTCLVSISGPAAGSITEGESGSYTVSLSQPAATDVTVKLTYSGTATDGSDYTAVTTVTVPAGQSSVTFDLKTLDDALAEGSETITISVGDITGGGFEAIAADPAQGSVTTTITDDVGGGGGGTPGSEDTCLVSITGPGEVVEGQVAEGYVVSLSQPSAQDVVVGLSYSGTAVDGSDFVRVASITIAAGQTQATFSISTLDDALAEGAEQFTVAIARIGAPGSEATAVDPAHGAVTTTLIDDVGGSGGGTPGAEDTCLVSISGPGEVVEGEVAGGYTVSLTQPAQTDVTVRLVCSGTASAGTDFIQVASVTIPAGQSQASFDLKTLDDALAEGTETITLTLGTISGGGFEAIAGDPARASVTTLLHDDAGPSGPGTPGAEDTCLVSISGPTTVVEGETAGGYTVSLSQPAATDVTVKLAYSGTATDGSDYSAVVTTVTIPAGQSSVAFDLKTLDDALAEGKETLTVSVGEISGGGFEAIVVHPLERSVTTTLLDDAGPFGPGTPGAEDTCLVSITGPAAVAEGAVASGYTVTLSQAAVTDVVIRLNYGGSASAGSDFAPVASVTIPAGSRSASFDLPTAADGVAEGGEQITVTLGTISGGGFEVLRGDPGAFSVTTQIADGNSAPVLQADRAVTPEDTAVSGNLLANDRDADGDTLTVTHFTWNDQSFTAGSSATIAGVGTLTVGSDGQFLFTPAKDYAGVVPAASCTVSDGHGHAAVSTLTLAITPVDDAPVLRGGSALLSEEGLPGGRPETGDPVTTCATGRLQFSDVDSSTLSFTLGAPSGLYSSGGVALSWSGDGSAAHPLVGSAGGQPVLSATIDAEGRYTVTLHAPLDHPVRGSEDLLTLSLGVQVSDGHSSSSATIDVGVRDDSPAPLCVARCADLSLVQTNLLVTLDVSGSMSTRDGIDGQTRLQSAIASIEKLIDSYAEHGDVMVRLVTFSTGASERGACWMTADQARSALHCLSAGGNTNYDAALDAARGAFDDPGRLVDGQNVAYFLSDGRPNLPTSDVGIDAAEQKTWESFLDSHDIRSYAIGLGCDVPVSALAPVAHDGVDHNDSISPLLVTRFEQLDAALAQTVADPVQGDLVAGGLDHAAGADGGHLSALIVDGVQHRWDPATSASDTVTVRTASGGEFTFNMENGHYSYQPPAGASHDYQEKIGFVLTDADGDSRTGSLTLGIDVDGNGHCDVQCAPATSCLVPDTSGCLTGSILNWSLADPCSHDGLTTTDATHTTSTGSCSSGGTTDTLHCGDLLTQAADLLAQWSSGGGTGGSCTSAPAPTCAPTPAPAPADCSGVLSSAEQLLAQTLIRQASDTSSHCGP